MKIGCATVVIAIWTLVAIILHFSGVGAFAVWPVIAGPFTWSCCALVIWDIILTVGRHWFDSSLSDRGFSSAAENRGSS